MDNCSQYDGLLIKYLSGELGTKEAENISEWIDSSEENAVYFQQFAAAWRLASLRYSFDKIDEEAEWKALKNRLRDESKILAAADYGLGAVEESRPAGGRMMRRILSAVSIAATVLIVAGIANFTLKSEKQDVSKAAGRNDRKQSVLIEPELKTEVNVSAVPKKLLLADGSSVTLYSGSELSYRKDFPAGARDFNLKGKADFTVSANKLKPFVVHNGDLSTTVLGTVFTVTSFEEARDIRIRLIEGKLLVRSDTTAVKKLAKDFYLLPGQELVYDKERAYAVVGAFGPATTVSAGNSKPKENPSLPEYSKGSWFMFNNQTLPDVFDQLEEVFNTEIIYSRNDIEKMYFIGKFDKTDSLDHILKKMSVLYHLKIEKSNNKYLVTKK